MRPTPSSPAPAASSAATSVHRLLADGVQVRAVDVKPFEEWYQRIDAAESLAARRVDPGRRRAGRRGRRHGVQPGRRHGRHGLHREQQGPVHAVGADLDPHARRGPAGRRASGSSTPRRPASTPRSTRPAPTWSPSARRTPTPPCPRTATAGRSSSPSGCAATSTRTSACRPASPATTTSTGPRAPGTAGGRRRPPPSAARWPRPTLSGDHRIEIWGDGRADAELHLHRRLRRGHAPHHGQRRHRAAQPGQRRAGHDQPARRHRRGGSPGSSSSAAYNLDAPQGVRGRNSDNTRITKLLGWAPSISLEDGLEQTYRWVYDQVAQQAGVTS